MLHNWPYFITRLCLLPKIFNKMCFVFQALSFDDILISEKLKFHYLNNKDNFRSEINNIFSLFLKCSLLDIANKLAKM